MMRNPDDGAELAQRSETLVSRLDVTGGPSGDGTPSRFGITDRRREVGRWRGIDEILLQWASSEHGD